MNTDIRYRRCLREGHRYGSRMILRDYRGSPVELRICEKCEVPETPRLRSLSTIKAKR